MHNPNGADACDASLAASDRQVPVIGMIARLHRVDTMTPLLHQI